MATTTTLTRIPFIPAMARSWSSFGVLLFVLRRGQPKDITFGCIENDCGYHRQRLARVLPDTFHPSSWMSSTFLRQLHSLGHRQLSTATTATTGRLPWFVDPTPFVRQKAPHLIQNGPAPLPEGVPTIIKNLHAALKTSPHLDQSELLVCEPIATPPGPPLPDAIPRGRRKRGRTYAGEGVAAGMVGGLWNWIVLAQVSSYTNGSL